MVLNFGVTSFDTQYVHFCWAIHNCELVVHCRSLLRQQAIMEAVIAKLEEQGTDEEVITSYKEQMTPAQRLQLDNFSRTINKYIDSAVIK